MNTDNYDSPAWRERIHTQVVNWQKPDASNGGSAGGQGCLEFGTLGEGENTEFFLRDTKQAHLPPALRPVLMYTRQEVAALVLSARNGQFDPWL